MVWRAPLGPAGAPGAHHEGGTRMGTDPKTSVVNRYGQSWDIPNLFVIGSSTFPTMSGFNPTLTIQALAYMSADRDREQIQEEPGRSCCTSFRAISNSPFRSSGVWESASRAVRLTRKDKPAVPNGKWSREKPWQPKKQMSSSWAWARRAESSRPSSAKRA